MEKIRYKLCLFIFSLFFLTCTNKAPEYPDLEGYWKEERIVDRQTGEEQECNRLYWAFQLGVAEIRDLGENGLGTHICRYEYDEGHSTLRMWDFRQKVEQDKKSSPENLSGFGIPSSDVTFEVVKADGDHLVLRAEEKILYFRSF